MSQESKHDFIDQGSILSSRLVVFCLLPKPNPLRALLVVGFLKMMMTYCATYQREYLSLFGIQKPQYPSTAPKKLAKNAFSMRFAQFLPGPVVECFCLCSIFRPSYLSFFD